MNSKKEIINIYKKKIVDLKKHNRLYFNNDNPEIPDSQFDDLKKKL
jgi:NAD-dependent DNA ligase